MSSNPFAGSPQIANLYDRNLQVAVQNQSVQADIMNSNKKSFTDLLSTGILAANRARISKRTNEVRSQISEANRVAQADRMREQEQIQFDNKVKFEQEKEKLNLQSFDKFLDWDRKNIDNSIDPDEALFNSYQEIKNRYMATGDARYAKLMMLRFGADNQEEVDLMVDGALDPDYSTPGSLELRQSVIRNRLTKKASSEEAVAKAAKATAESKMVKTQADAYVNAEVDLDSVVQRKTLDTEEKQYFATLSKDRASNLATDEGRKLVAKKKYDLDTVAGPTMEEINGSMKTMSSAIIKLYSAGGKYSLSPASQAAIQRIGGDGDKLANYLDSLTEKSFIINRGSLNDDEMRQVKQDILSSLKLMGSRANLIGKSSLGQTGVATDKDWVNNMSAMFTPGLSPDVTLWHMEKAANAFSKSMITQAAINGSPRVLERQLEMLHERGWRIDSNGNIQDAIGVRARLMDAVNSKLTPDLRTGRMRLRNPNKTTFSSSKEGSVLPAPMSEAGLVPVTNDNFLFAPKESLNQSDLIGGTLYGN